MFVESSFLHTKLTLFSIERRFELQKNFDLFHLLPDHRYQFNMQLCV